MTHAELHPPLILAGLMTHTESQAPAAAQHVPPSTERRERDSFGDLLLLGIMLCLILMVLREHTRKV